MNNKRNRWSNLESVTQPLSDGVTPPTHEFETTLETTCPCGNQTYQPKTIQILRDYESPMRINACDKCGRPQMWTRI